MHDAKGAEEGAEAHGVAHPEQDRHDAEIEQRLDEQESNAGHDQNVFNAIKQQSERVNTAARNRPARPIAARPPATVLAQSIVTTSLNTRRGAPN